MYFRLHLTPQSRQDLTLVIQLARTMKDFKLAQRCSAVLLLAQGLTQTVVAAAFAVCDTTISRWLSLYLADASAFFELRKSPGRPCRLTKARQQELVALLTLGPQACGYNTGVWTSGLVQKLILQRFGVTYSPRYISQLLRRMGMSYIKPKRCYARTKEDYREQIKWIREVFPCLYARVVQENGVLLFQDESSFQIQSNVIRTWCPKGKPSLHEDNPKRKHIRVIGVIELFSGQFNYKIHEGKLDNVVFASFLRRIAKVYKGKKVFMITDNAPYHGGSAVRKALEECGHLELIRLPKRSPFLNPIEKLWKELKKERSHGMYFKDVASLKRTVRKNCWAFQQDPERVKGLMKKWQAAGMDPAGCKEGEYDSSFIPEKAKKEYDLWLKENPSDIDNSLILQEV